MYMNGHKKYSVDDASRLSHRSDILFGWAVLSCVPVLLVALGSLLLATLLTAIPVSLFIASQYYGDVPDKLFLEYCSERAPTYFPWGQL